MHHGDVEDDSMCLVKSLLLNKLCLAVRAFIYLHLQQITAETTEKIVRIEKPATAP